MYSCIKLAACVLELNDADADDDDDDDDVGQINGVTGQMNGFLKLSYK